MPISEKRILVIEDDCDVANLLDQNLREEGYSVHTVHDGSVGLRLLDSDIPDLLILDLVLPGVDGLDICRHVRMHHPRLPIIMISGKGAEAQRILGLELGADDYVVKPFSVLEVVARVRALFRRFAAFRQITAMPSDCLVSGDLRLDPAAREVSLHQKTIALTVREFELLQFFMRHPGQVFSRIELLNKVWGYAHDGYEHTVNSHINRLRAKIEREPARPDYIATVWGVGYKFVGGPESGQ